MFFLKSHIISLFSALKYHSIFTHLTYREKIVLLDLSMRLPPQSILVEIGSYLGASSCFLGLGASRNRSTLYCVDTWMNDSMSEGIKDTWSSFIKNTEDFKNLIRPLKGRSQEISQSFSPKIDLLFIDGDHSYKSVRQDVESWLPKLKNSGIIIMHDIAWAEGVQKVLTENVKPRLKSFHALTNLCWGQLK